MPTGRISHRPKLLSATQLSLFPALLVGFCAAVAASQAPPPPNQTAQGVIPDAPQPQAALLAANTQTREVSLRDLPRNFFSDQGAIWTGPVRLRPHDLKWVMPLALATGAAIATDHRAMQVVSQDGAFNNANVTASNALIGGFIAVPVALLASGHFQQDDHASEAGILTGESMLDSVVVEEVLKQAFRRERPNVDDARGKFFQGNMGLDSSFPSSHSLIAWSAASSFAGEYRSPWVQIAAYSGATAVSLTRVLGREHFPSDVVVGACLGWLIGHYVVEKHHRPLKTLIARRSDP